VAQQAALAWAEWFSFQAVSWREFDMSRRSFDKSEKGALQARFFVAIGVGLVSPVSLRRAEIGSGFFKELVKWGCT